MIKESAIRNKRAQRQGLLKGIISLFEKDPDSDNTDADDLPLLAFASEILAHLPYSALDDPLFLVYSSSCVTALDGQTIINDFARLLGGDLCDPNAGEDSLEQAGKNKGAFNPEDFGLESKSAGFGQLCVNACSFSLPTAVASRTQRIAKRGVRNMTHQKNTTDTNYKRQVKHRQAS